MIEAMKQIEIASKDKISKEELECLISDKFRQLADALKIAIPSLGSHLPDIDSLPVSSTIDLIAVESNLKKEEKHQKNLENEDLKRDINNLREQMIRD